MDVLDYLFSFLNIYIYIHICVYIFVTIRSFGKVSCLLWWRGGIPYICHCNIYHHCLESSMIGVYVLDIFRFKNYSETSIA